MLTEYDDTEIVLFSRFSYNILCELVFNRCWRPNKNRKVNREYNFKSCNFVFLPSFSKFEKCPFVRFVFRRLAS